MLSCSKSCTVLSSLRSLCQVFLFLCFRSLFPFVTCFLSPVVLIIFVILHILCFVPYLSLCSHLHSSLALCCDCSVMWHFSLWQFLVWIHFLWLPKFVCFVNIATTLGSIHPFWPCIFVSIFLKSSRFWWSVSRDMSLFCFFLVLCVIFIFCFFVTHPNFTCI